MHVHRAVSPNNKDDQQNVKIILGEVAGIINHWATKVNHE